ncbi:SEC-C domain-containing protein [Acinetobacter sp. YH12025]|uniref:SEC-C domain-containing protein n=1 Tax=Acinetobacter sp. YH12025 TaxID=2601042 RepID=UPI0015D40D6A|nr:SEC-C domain-containing protein [Acinetobacter sp. YH12025]
MSGVARNKPCHCGSGLKYKKCHLIIEEQLQQSERHVSPKLEIHELQKLFDDTLFFETCIASNLKHNEKCSDKIINAHTLTKSLSLEKIAKSGHIYSFKSNGLYDLIRNKGVVTLNKLGIRKASTFKGFCSYHDDFLFRSIEKENFELSKRQILALFYRGFALEYYKKKGVLEHARKSFKPLLKNFDADIVHIGSLQLVANLKRAKLDFEDTVNINLKISEYLKDNETSLIETYAIQTEYEIPFVGTGLFALYKNIDGEVIQDIYDYDLENLEYMSLNIFYAKDGKSWIVLSWLKKCNSINKDFVIKLKKYSIDDQINIIGNMMILYTENCYFSIDYIDSMTPSKKRKIEKVYNDTLRGNFESLLFPNFIFNNIEAKTFEV